MDKSLERKKKKKMSILTFTVKRGKQTLGMEH